MALPQLRRPRRRTLVIAALALLLVAGVLAAAGAVAHERGEGQRDCSQADNPERCQAHQRMHRVHAFCRQNPDEPRCQEMQQHADQHRDARHDRHEAYCGEHPDEPRCQEAADRKAAYCGEHPDEPRCQE